MQCTQSSQEQTGITSSSGSPAERAPLSKYVHWHATPMQEPVESRELAGPAGETVAVAVEVGNVRRCSVRGQRQASSETRVETLNWQGYTRGTIALAVEVYYACRDLRHASTELQQSAQSLVTEFSIALVG